MLEKQLLRQLSSGKSQSESKSDLECPQCHSAIDRSASNTKLHVCVSKFVQAIETRLQKERDDYDALNAVSSDNSAELGSRGSTSSNQALLSSGGDSSGQSANLSSRQRKAELTSPTNQDTPASSTSIKVDVASPQDDTKSAVKRRRRFFGTDASQKRCRADRLILCAMLLAVLIIVLVYYRMSSAVTTSFPSANKGPGPNPGFDLPAVADKTSLRGGAQQG
jgi:hypothetical protein